MTFKEKFKKALDERIGRARKINIIDFLASAGFEPVRTRGGAGRRVCWYPSPFRKETVPSFKADESTNLWFDFGGGVTPSSNPKRGGDIIDLVRMLNPGMSFMSALEIVDPKSGKAVSPPPGLFPAPGREADAGAGGRDAGGITVEKVLPLNHPALKKYLVSRGIDFDTARMYAREVRYGAGGRHFFGLGMKNRSGCYEIRNVWGKVSQGHKDISLVPAVFGSRQASCAVFEGFTDFLSYKTMERTGLYPEILAGGPQDSVILNSVAMVSAAVGELRLYDFVHCFLDNDEAGRRAAEEIKRKLGDRVSDESWRYAGYKDLNDFLTGKRKPEEGGENGGGGSESESEKGKVNVKEQNFIGEKAPSRETPAAAEGAGRETPEGGKSPE